MCAAAAVRQQFQDTGSREHILAREVQERGRQIQAKDEHISVLIRALQGQQRTQSPEEVLSLPSAAASVTSSVTTGVSAGGLNVGLLSQQAQLGGKLSGSPLQHYPQSLDPASIARGMPHAISAGGIRVPAGEVAAVHRATSPVRMRSGSPIRHQ